MQPFQFLLCQKMPDVHIAKFICLSSTEPLKLRANYWSADVGKYCIPTTKLTPAAKIQETQQLQSSSRECLMQPE